MGVWGYKSFSNDETMDYMDGLDASKPITVLNKVWRETDENLVKLGSVIFILANTECKIPLTKLKEAMKIAKSNFEDENWVDEHQRRMALAEEIEILRKEIQTREK